MGTDVFKSFEQITLDRLGMSKNTHSSDADETGDNLQENKGKMIVDATVAEQAIRYPTDISLLNEAREISEELIDELFALSMLSRKPRTYRQKARRQYLSIAKKRKLSLKERRRGIREQLQYLRRNLGHIGMLLDDLGSMPFPLSATRQRQYWIIQHVYFQQDMMNRSRSRRCDDRIVSISQPHVSPDYPRQGQQDNRIWSEVECQHG